MPRVAALPASLPLAASAVTGGGMAGQRAGNRVAGNQSSGVAASVYKERCGRRVLPPLPQLDQPVDPRHNQQRAQHAPIHKQLVQPVTPLHQAQQRVAEAWGKGGWVGWVVGSGKDGWETTRSHPACQLHMRRASAALRLLSAAPSNLPPSGLQTPATALTVHSARPCPPTHPPIVLSTSSTLRCVALRRSRCPDMAPTMSTPAQGEAAGTGAY